MLAVGAVIVSRPKAKLPRLTLGAPSEFALDDQQWREIEAAFGYGLDVEVRREITDITNQFLRFDEAEASTGHMEDAVRRTRQLCKDAISLLGTLSDTSQYSDIVCDYVDDTIAVAGGQNDLQNFTAQIIWFVKACTGALDEMEEMSRQSYWPGGRSWQDWIAGLTKIAKSHGLPTSARKDSAKAKTEKMSSFVNLVGELQEHIPAARRRSKHSPSALAGAINAARRQPKPLTKRVNAARRQPKPLTKREP
jgi:hypothetical protein